MGAESRKEVQEPVIKKEKVTKFKKRHVYLHINFFMKESTAARQVQILKSRNCVMAMVRNPSCKRKKVRCRGLYIFI